jgi:hypothetical protein
METIENKTETLVREISQPLERAAGWIKFIGIVLIVYGVVLAISIIGLILAWLPIWLGVLLLKASNKSRFAFFSGDKNSLIDALLSLNNYFTIYGVMIIISVVIGIVVSLFLIFTGALLHGFNPENFIF